MHRAILITATTATLAATVILGLFACQRYGFSPTYALSGSVYVAPHRTETRAEGDERRKHNTESYDRIYDNPFLLVAQNPLSTFSIDVDTASYANTRRFLNSGQLPPPDAVRIEELINYFSYEYRQPLDDAPFAIETEVAPAPWNPDHLLVHLGLQGRRIAAGQQPPRNLVFLLDVSGSMDTPNKLPLLKRAMGLLVEQLTGRDRVAIVVYAGASGLVLPATSGANKGRILRALDDLSAGGSTNGGGGIELAYRIARKQLIPSGVNRVILATDGDFNVGSTSRGKLTRMIERQREGGVFLTVLGLGMGNYKDATLEQLADKGNGNYAYIDTLNEARKVLVREIGATLVTIAKDVKIQVEFNPNAVRAYRLIGYENRLLRAEDFKDDKKDAGEIGAGHTVTALYEVVPRGANTKVRGVGSLKYQTPRRPTGAAHSEELLTMKVRFKRPRGQRSKLVSLAVAQPAATRRPSDNFRFSAAVAAFGMLLRGSEHRGTATFRAVRALAEGAVGQDRNGYRKEFIELVDQAAARSTGSRGSTFHAFRQ